MSDTFLELTLIVGSSPAYTGMRLQTVSPQVSDYLCDRLRQSAMPLRLHKPTDRAADVVSVVVREHEGNRVSVRLVPPLPRLSAAPRSATYGLGTNGRSPIRSASCAIRHCNHDQPLCKKSIAPSARLISSGGYIRLYGHNCQNNFKENPQTGDPIKRCASVHPGGTL